MTRALTDRERTADRLLKASAAHSHDPLTEIDWDAPPLPGRWYSPPHRVTLYRTPLWDRLTEAQRIELSKHEVASVASLGIWFELILMQLLVRHVADLDPRSRHVQYALTEIADECRHSVMFGRMIDTFGAPHYAIHGIPRWLGKFFGATAGGPHMFAAILIAEEITDTLQREAMVDDRVQPLVQHVSRIHVVEEARHVRYAREELVRQLAVAGRAKLALSRLLIARAAYLVSVGLVRPAVYRAVGLDPREARAVARANPYHQESLRFAARRVVEFLDELGLIAGPGRALWRRSLLI